jgi:outer membrane protein assembly factor BamB
MLDLRALTSVLLGLTLLAGSSVTAAGENWPQWRGPGGQGVSADAQVPTEWAPGKNVLWKAELPGTGMSSPIVWDDRIYVTAVIEGDVVPGQRAVKHRQGPEADWIHPDSVAADKKHTFKVVALDAKSGKILWDRTAYEGTVFDARHRRSSFAGPTPVTDGAMVYAYFGPEGLYAYNSKGDLAWKAVAPFATLGLGTGTSPILYENLVIIQRDEDNGDHSTLVAYDKKTGKEVWSTKRTVEISWSTPVLVTAGGRTELVTNGNDLIIAYDPATGKELWQTTGVKSNAIHTPLVGHGLVILTAGYPVKKVIAIRPGPVADGQRVAWEYTRGTGYVLSNILYGDYLYLFTDNGIVTCLDPKTGAVKYEGGRIPVPARFMGSPVAFGGFVAMTSEGGDTFMLKAGPTHEIVRTNSIDEPVYSSPAIANGRLYIRADKHLFAIGK